jgi:bifunctional lysine-specific demethylase and histidyl-hydroxylase NO66
MNALACLAALVAPLDVATFFERYYEKEPVHLRRGVSTSAPPLLTHEALLAALGGLAGHGGPPEGLVAFPEHAGVADVGALLADPSLLRGYLAAGHPLVWNRARGVAPAVDALAASLAEALGAHVWPNVYATGTAGTPFSMHFDSHEVIAVHCEGHKDWTISAVRVDRPLDAAAMEAAVRAAQVARCKEAEARPLLRFTVGPGDAVYIPRGQFHNARTPEGRSLHVTFGVRQLTGLDVVELLAREALADPLFREFLPAAAVDPDGSRAAAWLAGIAARLARELAGEGLVHAVAAARARLVRCSLPPRGRGTLSGVPQDDPPSSEIGG